MLGTQGWQKTLDEHDGEADNHILIEAVESPEFTEGEKSLNDMGKLV